MRAKPFTPSAIRSTSEGSGSGAQAARSSGSAGTGERSNSTVEMSTPAMPSTSAWCVFEISAKRSPPSSPCRPWISHTSQSGFERSSRWEKMRPTSWRSWSIEPGAGRAVWRRW